MHSPIFDQLRTKEQLGYTVWADDFGVAYYSTVSLRILVQGSRDPTYVEGRINNFLADFEVIFKNFGKILKRTFEMFILTFT